VLVQLRVRLPSMTRPVKPRLPMLRLLLLIRGRFT